MKSESGATEKPYFLMSNDYCWDFVIDRFPPTSSRTKTHHCGIKLGFNLDVIIRGQSTTTFLCIGPFST